jgi:hypothetical protein
MALALGSGSQLKAELRLIDPASPLLFLAGRLLLSFVDLRDLLLQSILLRFQLLKLNRELALAFFVFD